MTSARVFVLNSHAKHSLVAIRNLGKRGLEVTAGSSRRWSVGESSKYAARSITTPDPVEAPEDYLRVLEAELRRRPYDMLLPINEPTVELVVKNRDRLEPHTTIPFTQYQKLLVGIDKSMTVEAARTLGIPHPRTMLKGEIDFDSVEQELGLPVVVKPHRGSSRKGVSVCHSVEEAKHVFEATTDEYGPTLIQEFIPQGGERGVYTCYDRSSDLVGVTVQRRIRSNPPEGGASTFRETVDDPRLIAASDRFLSELGWMGVAMVEYRVDPRDDEAKLVEVNPRLWGSLALSVFAGVEFPYLLYRLAIDESIEPNLDYRIGVRARCLFTDLMQVSNRRDRLQALREFLTPSTVPTCHDIVSLTDPKPTFVELLYLLDSLASSTSFGR